MARLLAVLAVFILTEASIVAQVSQLSFPFNGNAQDISANNVNGVVSGATLVKDRFGKFSNAYYFDGIDDFIAIPHHPAYKTQFPISVSLWVWLDDSSSTNTIFTNNDNSSEYYGIVVNANSGKMSIGFGDGTGASSVSRRTAVGSTVLKSKKWHHLAGTIHGSTNMDLYVDGVQESVTYSGTGAGVIAYSASNNGKIGSYDRSTGSPFYLKGGIDDIELWNDSLSLSDVQNLFSPGPFTDLFDTTSLKLGFEFDSLSVDASSFQNDGAISGATKVLDRFGDTSAYYFDGFDDFISIPYDTSFRCQFPITISMWVWLEDSSASNVFFTNNDHTDRYYGISVNTSGNTAQASMSFGDGTGSSFNDRRTVHGTSLLPSKSWIHLAGIIRGATDMDLFVNGVKETVSYSGSGGPLMYTSTQDGRLANYDRTSGAPIFFNGALDDVYLWNRELTSQEIACFYLPGSINSLGLIANEVDEVIAQPLVYPNPSQGIFKIENTGSCEMTVTNIYGQVVQKENAFQGTHILNMEHQPNGVYFLTLRYNSLKKLTVKLLKN